jgi:hypothetical protein
MNQVLWLRALLVLAAILGMFMLRRGGLWLGVIPSLLTRVQAVTLGPHAYSGLAFMASYAGKAAWGAARALACVAPATAGTPAAQPSTG